MSSQSSSRSCRTSLDEKTSYDMDLPCQSYLVIGMDESPALASNLKTTDNAQPISELRRADTVSTSTLTHHNDLETESKHLRSNAARLWVWIAGALLLFSLAGIVLLSFSSHSHRQGKLELVSSTTTSTSNQPPSLSSSPSLSPLATASRRPLRSPSSAGVVSPTTPVRPARARAPEKIAAPTPVPATLPLSIIATPLSLPSSSSHTRGSFSMSPTPLIIERPSLRPTKADSNQPTTCVQGQDRAWAPSATPPLPGKKGIGLTLRESGQLGSWVENLPRLQALQVYWNYRWGLDRIDAQPEDVEFVPMVFGAAGNITTADLLTKLQQSVLPQIEAGRVKRLLGFNEPDRANQGNVEADRAWELWPALEAMNVTLISPSCAQPTGPWMDTFMGQIQGHCRSPTGNRVDWIGVHWYGAPNLTAFTNQMTQIYHYHGQRPLLLTEFAPADWQATSPANNRYSVSQILAFMKQALPWLERQEWIAGYAWFPFDQSSPAGSSSALFDATTRELTACGQFYASVRLDLLDGNQTIEV